MFSKLFGRKKGAETLPTAPEIMGLRLGGAFMLDDLRLRLVESELIVEGVAKTQLIQAVGEVKLDANTTALRYYTDDDGFLQVLLSGGMTESHVADVKLWYFYETKGANQNWDPLLESGISQPSITLEGHNYERVWQEVDGDAAPVAMTEKTYNSDGSTTETDQFMMLYERQINESLAEYVTYAGEEKIIDDRADRCFVISTGFDIQPADITIIGS